MKKEVVSVDKERGICRVTTSDERFYTRESRDQKSGLPVIVFRPSITYIGRFCPKGKGFEEYLKEKGKEADELVQLAGERGSKVHQAIEVLNNGGTVKMDSPFTNTTTGRLEELTSDEYWCVMTYQRWWGLEGKENYEILGVEETIWPEGEGSEPGGDMHWAGTLDIRVKRLLDGAIGVIDIKTSKGTYASHITQVSALCKGVNASWGAILQVGYGRTIKGYKFTLVNLDFDLFLAAKKFWKHEVGEDAPLQREYPLELNLGLKSGDKSALHLAGKRGTVKKRSLKIKPTKPR